ncbi:MAG: transglycosylase domain-containing protein, partial [bacterium]
MRGKLKALLAALKRGLANRKQRRCLIGAVAVAGLFLLLLHAGDASFYLKVHPSPELRDRSGRLLFAFLNERGSWCFERSLEEFGPRIIQATIAAEDQRFYHHCGVDPLAVLRAVKQNLQHRRVVSGASTLTMQVVKRRGFASRSYLAKLCQAFEALRLETHADKNQILSTYLNTAPYGGNLTGCEAAARRFFGKPTKELTLSEAALVAGLPKSPTRLYPLAHPEHAMRRRNYVLARMRDEGFISETEYRQAAAEPVRVSWHAFPRWSPHFAFAWQWSAADRGPLATTLDLEIQMATERLVKTRVGAHQGMITNAAVIVLDAPTASVLARVGSADYFDSEAAGQFDACRASRSPGSTLKPFLYGLALEQNRLYPTEQRRDDSLEYGLYSPENFDQRYHGLVEASEALRRSLNVPAVTLLDRVGVENFQTFLQSLSLTTLR